LRVAINAQLLPDQGVGGAQTALIGLVRALGQLDDGPEEYTIIGPWQQPDWLAPYLGPNQHIVPGPQPPQRFNRVPRVLHPMAQAARQAVMNLLGSEITHQPYTVPVSNGFYEALNCDVIHFPFQQFVITSVPAVFNPYDLQHLHFPQFFAPGEIARRETLYPAGCRIAQRVTVASTWSKNDIAARYGIPPQKIQVIPLAPPTTAYSAPTGDLIRTVRERYRLPESFVLYPAMTWPHKNHLRLLEAAALLRDRDKLRIHVICVGEQHQPHWATIQARLETLQLADQVQFLGFVPSDHLLALYHAAQFVIIPSLFEGAGLPLLEAWQAEVPAACSAVTSLAEEAADAALLFDPTSVDAIAGAIRQLTTDETLCAEYRRRGIQRLKAFSWERTARAYRAVYRQLAGIPLDETEQSLLAANWMESA
jgi:glycosyltransferase involved in cell wall biosynthesis